MKAGTYKARVKDYGMILNQKGAPQVKVVFTLDEGGIYSYFGNLGTPKQQEFTTKVLMTLGATPQNIDKVENGPQSGALDMFKVVELVIEDRTYNGKTYQQIKYINDPNRAPSQKFTKGTGALAVLKGQAAQIAAVEGIAPKEESPF